MLSRTLIVVLSFLSFVWIAYVGITLVNSNIDPKPSVIFSTQDTCVIVVHKPTELDFNNPIIHSLQEQAFYTQLLNETERIQHYYFSTARELAILERSKPWSIEIIKRYAEKLNLSASISATKKVHFSNGWSGLYHDNYFALFKGELNLSDQSIVNWNYIDRKSSCSIIEKSPKGFLTENVYFSAQNNVKYISQSNTKALPLIDDQDLFQEVIPADFESYQFFEKNYLKESYTGNAALFEWVNKGVALIQVNGSPCIITDIIPGQDPLAIVNAHINGGYVQGEKKATLTSFSLSLIPQKMGKAVLYAELFNNLLFVSTSQNTINQILGSYETGNTLAQSTLKREKYFQNTPKKVSTRILNSSEQTCKSVLKGSIHSVIQLYQSTTQTISEDEEEFQKQLQPLRLNDNLVNLIPIQRNNGIFSICADNTLYYTNQSKILWSKELTSNLVGNASYLDNSKNIVFATADELHSFGQNGEETSGFPVSINKALSGVYPYVWKGENQYAVSCMDGIHCYNSKGKEVFYCATSKNGISTEIAIQGLNGDLFAHVLSGSNWTTYNLKRKKVLKQRELGKGDWYFSKIGKSVFAMGISNKQFVRISENGSKAMLVGNTQKLFKHTLNNEDVYFVQQQNELFVITGNGIVLGQITSRVTSIEDVAIVRSTSGKYLLGIIDGIANNCYIYTLKGAELDKVEFEGSNKIVFHQHADGTIYLTTQSNNYLVRYPINY